jgi:hypothetical protein
VLERIQFGGMSISVEIGYRRVRIEVAKVLVGPVARLRWAPQRHWVRGCGVVRNGEERENRGQAF